VGLDISDASVSGAEAYVYPTAEGGGG